MKKYKIGQYKTIIEWFEVEVSGDEDAGDAIEKVLTGYSEMTSIDDHVESDNSRSRPLSLTEKEKEKIKEYMVTSDRVESIYSCERIL